MLFSLDSGILSMPRLYKIHYIIIFTFETKASFVIDFRSSSCDDPESKLLKYLVNISK